MRFSLPVLRVPRRLASQVLESAQAKLAEGSAPESQVYFGELPEVLQTFFKKYPPSPFKTYATEPRATNDPEANPFLANKHPITQVWHKPKYSMRRQADLWKAAYRFGIPHLLPQLLHNRLFYEDKYAEGTRVRGAQLFKLTRRERKAPERAREVAEAIGKLDEKIAERKGRRFTDGLAEKKRVGYV